MLFETSKLFDCAYYYDTDIYLDETMFSGLLEYIQLNYSSIKRFEHDGNSFMIDTNMLNKKINLNCFNCRNVYGCCDGAPIAMGAITKEVFDKHIGNIVDIIRENDADRYNELLANGGFINSDGSINAYDGKCAFVLTGDHIGRCAIHKYADDNNISLYDICPFSCLLQPMEIIVLCCGDKQTYLITSMVDPKFSDEFSRWGDMYGAGLSLRCLIIEKHDKVFRKEDYNPVYEVQRKLIENEFGSQVYKMIAAFCRAAK